MAATVIAAALGAALLPAGTAVGQSNNGNGPNDTMTLAVFGDSPYGAPTDVNPGWQLAKTPQFINFVNADPDVSTVVHVGDIHSGKDVCSQAYDQQVADLWTGFQDPVVYTPGDNEWADCHKAAEGGGDPLTNLGYVRDIFFAQPGYTLGGGNLHVVSQAKAYDPAHPEDAQFVENVMYVRHGVRFVTLNIPGGSNNDADPWHGSAESAGDTSRRTDEIAKRSAADLRWLDQAFAAAASDGDKAVVIITQADMFDLDGKPSSHLSNYGQFIQSIADNTAAFAKPVLMFNGDSHVYRSDNPLVNDAPCSTEDGGAVKACSSDDFDNINSSTLRAHLATLDLSNFHRVVVHGSTGPLEWLKLTIDSHTANPTTEHSFGPFSWARQVTTLVDSPTP